MVGGLPIRADAAASAADHGVAAPGLCPGCPDRPLVGRSGAGTFPARWRADPVPALRASLDDARNVEQKLQAELASRRDDLRKRQEHCKLTEPPLPAERWSRG